MFSTRVIVVLTIMDGGLYRTKAFKSPSYVGDPLNAIRIFNDKEVDELLVLDISPKRIMTDEKFKLYANMASQAFMPTSFGGGLTSLEQMEKLFFCGYDKVVINTSTVENPALVSDAASKFGTQSVVASIDVGGKLFGGDVVCVNLGKKKTNLSPVDHARRCEELGAGEVLIRSIAHDGMMQGYDTELIAKVASAVSVPVVGAGGAGTIEDLSRALEAGAQSVSAGSMFVYHGKHRAVLINYPGPDEFDRTQML
jgi:cyclase